MLENTYARLPPRFYARLEPTPAAAPRLIKWNQALAEQLQLDLNPGDATALAQIFSGNQLLPGSEPLAMVYAGQQFGHFVPQLGDGRAILLGEARNREGRLQDIHLKGSGRTPYSRGGDGRAALGPVLREYIVSEAMTALGVPSTRTLAAVTTGETVFRDGAVPGAVLARTAASHVRIGTFQYFAARGDVEAVRILADYVIERHYPQLAGSAEPYLELLKAVVQRQAALVARWLQVGFIHGVMNTDNSTVSGETIDYGPCAFLDAYDPNAVFSSIDRHGRYAFANQPAIAQWNLARLAETLLPLIDADTDRAVAKATDCVNIFSQEFESRWLAGMRAKLGLATVQDGDAELIEQLLGIMQRTAADFTRTFRGLCSLPGPEDADPAFSGWLNDWRARGAAEKLSPPERSELMRGANPKYIPRNHRIEQAIAAAVEREDFTLFETLLTVLTRPYDDQPSAESYTAPPAAEERVLQTFCGTCNVPRVAVFLVHGRVGIVLPTNVAVQGGGLDVERSTGIRVDELRSAGVERRSRVRHFDCDVLNNSTTIVRASAE
jgi:serine/tyrosine/threonine adenylyltransferase